MPTLAELARHVAGKVVGNGDCVIERVATLQNAGKGDISFLANRKYYKYLSQSKADAVIVSKKDAGEVPGNAIVVEDSYVSYAKIARLLYPEPKVIPGIEKTACIHSQAQVSDSAYVGHNVVIGAGSSIAPGCVIGHGCVIGDNVSIGDHSRLVCNVTILNDCQVGERAMLHPGVVIGADGFGLANDKGTWLKIPQTGCVRLGNDVEVGANTTIDRGAIGDTVIGDGVKLDNLIQIGHNVSIGAHTVIAAAAAIAGSTSIGKHCAIGGKTGIVGHLEIVDNVQIMGMSQVTQSISEPGAYASGTPVQPVNQWHRNYARYRQLEELARRVKKIEKNSG